MDHAEAPTAAMLAIWTKSSLAAPKTPNTNYYVVRFLTGVPGFQIDKDRKCRALARFSRQAAKIRERIVI